MQLRSKPQRELVEIIVRRPYATLRPMLFLSSTGKAQCELPPAFTQPCQSGFGDNGGEGDHVLNPTVSFNDPV